jgi:VanZ family protein
MQRIIQVMSWSIAIAIVVLSLIPPSYRPITDASQNVEHFTILLGNGVAFGLGYPDRPFVLAISLVIFCGAVELLQLWVPGRHARLNDFIVDVAAALVGLSVTSIATRLSMAR